MSAERSTISDAEFTSDRVSLPANLSSVSTQLSSRTTVASGDHPSQKSLSDTPSIQNLDPSTALDTSATHQETSQTQCQSESSSPTPALEKDGFLISMDAKSSRNRNSSESLKEIECPSSSSTSQSSAQPAKVQNKFVNDGSFLAMILEQQRSETAKKNAALETKKRGKNTTVPHSKKQKPSIAHPPSESTLCHPENDDPMIIKAKQEFIQAMEIMEEAGLVTEKGIGSGMVK